MVHATSDNVKFFFEGDEYFESLWNDLAAAKYSIFIEMYLLSDDDVGQELKKILIQKAIDGIKIKILIDAIGSLSLPYGYINELKEAGVLLKIYHPLRLLLPSKLQLNKRDHRKLIIIDSRIGYMGGANLYKNASKKYYGEKRWQDTQVRIIGQMVGKMVYHFKRSFKEIRFRSKRFEKFSYKNDIVATRNRFGRNHIRRFIQRYFKRSRKQIAISTAYFIPDIKTIFKLVRARKRGVRVQIITNGPEHNDVPIVNRINRPILKYLIKRGIEIYFYKERMIHSKFIIFDNKISTLGSANLNYRSFFRDLEINVFLRKEVYIQRLKKQFETNLQNSRLVTLKELKNISFVNKIIDAFFYLFRSFF